MSSDITSDVITHYNLTTNMDCVHVLDQRKLTLKLIKDKFFGLDRIRDCGALRSLLLKKKYELMHIHFGSNFNRMAAALMLINHQIPMILSYHGSDLNVLLRNNQDMAKSHKRYLDLFNNLFLTFPSESLRRKHFEIFGAEYNSAVIPNFVDSAFFSSARLEKQNKKQIISIGRLIEAKGGEQLIIAFSESKIFLRGYRLLLIGEGPEYFRLNQLISKLELQEYISIKTMYGRDEIIREFSKSCLYVQPSLVTNDGTEESFGLAAAEAASFGLRTVIYDVGGLCELKKYFDNIEVVPQGNIGRLTAKIMELTTELSPTYIPAQQGLHWRNIGHHWRTLYKQAIS